MKSVQGIEVDMSVKNTVMRWMFVMKATTGILAPPATSPVYYHHDRDDREESFVDRSTGQGVKRTEMYVYV